MKINCPACKKEVEYSESNVHRPFCSERCKLLDLGDWAMEKHAIPADHDASEDDSTSEVEKEKPKKPAK